MHNRFAAVLAAAVFLLLSACAGESALDDANVTSTPSGRVASTPSEVVEGTRQRAISVLAIGVQPVPDTPVASLPAHPGHEPLNESLPSQPEALPVAPPPTRVWFVSPSGADTAEGSEAKPFRTISKAVSVASPGELVRVAGGTYAEKVVLADNVQAGRADAKITLQGEGKPKIVPVTTGKDGMVQIRQPNWVVDGFDIDVKGQAQYGVEFSGNVSGSVLANSDVHDGSFGAGVTTYGNANGATIENNHIHGFSRGNLDSHGVVVQTTTKNVTIRNNDIHDNSGDSVQCLGPEGFNNNAPADGVLIENNHLFSNRENGIDVKTCRRVTIRNNRIHGFAPTTTAKGDAIVVHYSAADVKIEGNEIFDASKGISVGGNHVGPVPKNVVIARNRIHGIKTDGGGEGTGIRIENSEGARVVNNTLEDISGTALILGHGTGGPTSNGTVVNNIIVGATLVNLGNFTPGLKMNANLYAKASGKFTAMQAPLDFDGWKARGLDTASTLGDPKAAAVDQGSDVGLPFCGQAPDLGALESGC